MLAAPLVAGRRAAQPRAARRGSAWPGRYGFYEAIDFTPGASARGRDARRRAADLHGAPPGHEPGRARQRAARLRRCSGASTPIRACRRPTCCCRSASRTRCRSRTRRSSWPSTCRRPARPPAVAVRALRDAAHAEPAAAPAVERLVRRHGHQRRRRLQPAPADRDDALARGRHDRRLGQLLLRARPRHRGAVWSTTPTSRPRASRTNTRCTFAPDRAVFRRVDGDIETRTEIVVSPEDDAELRRVSVTNLGTQAAPPRPHQLRGGRAGAGRRRPRASGVQQPVRRDAQRAGARRADRRAAAAIRQRAPVPRARAQRPRAAAARRRSSKPTAPGSSAAAARSTGRCALDRRRPAVEHHRAGPRSDRQPAAADPARARRHRPDHLHDRLRRERGAARAD